MNWQTLLLFVVALVLVLLLRSRSGRIPPEEARRILRDGGVLIDVRSPEEHRRDHIAGSVNLPLDGIAESVLKRFPSKESPMLLHCFSGARSDAAVAQLKELGYLQVHNLGGLEQARRIVEGGR